MEEIAKRLKQILEEKEMNALEFSERVGIQRSSLSHLFSGRNKPSIDLLLKIKKQFPETDLDWLITGEQSKFTTKSEETPSLANQNEPKIRVTDVNIKDELTDYVNDINKNTQTQSAKIRQQEIDRVILFYRDGSFKEYKN